MEQNASLSLLPPAGGNIMAMRGGAVMQGGNVPVGFDPTASVIPLTPHQVNIEGMKGGAETIIDRILANLATIRTRIQDKCTQINDYASASVAESESYCINISSSCPILSFKKSVTILKLVLVHSIRETIGSNLAGGCHFSISNTLVL